MSTPLLAADVPPADDALQAADHAMRDRALTTGVIWLLVDEQAARDLADGRVPAGVIGQCRAVLRTEMR